MFSGFSIMICHVKRILDIYRLYASWGVELESGMNRPNDLGSFVQSTEQYHWM